MLRPQSCAALPQQCSSSARASLLQSFWGRWRRSSADRRCCNKPCLACQQGFAQVRPQLRNPTVLPGAPSQYTIRSVCTHRLVLSQLPGSS